MQNSKKPIIFSIIPITPNSLSKHTPLFTTNYNSSVSIGILAYNKETIFLNPVPEII
jgi:hypothetical protein